MKQDGAKAPRLPKVRSIPTFATEDEERAWWASHDTSDLPGEDVSLERPRNADRLPRVITVPADAATVERLRRLARARGVDYHDMVRAWLSDRLAAETGD
jgi:hypothetical protein